MKKMTIWGVGPKIMTPSYFLLVVLSLLPIKIGISAILNIPRLYITVAGIFLICVGIIILAMVNTKINKALKTNHLVTTGLFSLVRNPMYVAHLFFLIPGVCLLTDNATTLVSVICGMIAFNILIPVEEKCLEENFGSEYINYKNRVRRLAPRF